MGGLPRGSETVGVREPYWARETIVNAPGPMLLDEILLDDAGNG